MVRTTEGAHHFRFYLLAIALAMSGAEVIAVDKNRDEIELIRDQVSLAVRLDSTDEEALQAQGIDISGLSWKEIVQAARAREEYFDAHHKNVSN